MTTGWRKSTRSSSQGNGDCVEARKNEAAYQMRDSKLGESSPIFNLNAQEFVSVLRAAQR